MKRPIKNPGRGYAGHEKVKLYHYDNKGKFIKEFESQADLRKEYFFNDEGKRPLYNGKRWKLFNYDILPDNTYYSNYKIGRENILKYERVYNSKYCINKVTDKHQVKMYNLLHEEIANFKNIYIASLITKLPSSKIHRSCNEGKNKPKSDIYFQYVKLS